MPEKQEQSCRTNRDNGQRTLFVVLSYNGLDDTLACLQSIYASNHEGVDLMVIDNASFPTVVEPIQEKYPSLEILALPKNIGWAAGNNLGAKLGMQRGYKWICLLNNDLVFPEGEVARFHNAMHASPAALVHPRIYYWDEPNVAQLDPSIDSTGAPNLNATWWHENIVLEHSYGACLGVHRTIFEKIGYFDERLFLQLEETDFHHRASDAGFTAVCAPTVKIYHKESRSFGGKRTPAKAYYTTRNSLLLIEKRRLSIRQKAKLLRNLYWTVSSLAAQTSGARNSGPVSLAHWLCSKSLFAAACRHGARDYFKRRFGKIPVDLAVRLQHQPATSVIATPSSAHEADDSARPEPEKKGGAGEYIS